MRVISPRRSATKCPVQTIGTCADHHAPVTRRRWPGIGGVPSRLVAALVPVLVVAAMGPEADAQYQPGVRLLNEALTGSTEVLIRTAAALPNAPGDVFLGGRIDPNGATLIGLTADGGLLGTTSLSPRQGWIYQASAIQGGNVVMAGMAARQSGSNVYQAMLFARYLADGSLDGSFGSRGLVTQDFGSDSAYVNDLAVDGSGRLIGVGRIQYPGGSRGSSSGSRPMGPSTPRSGTGAFSTSTSGRTGSPTTSRC